MTRNGRRLEEVTGRRVETIEYGLRKVQDDALGRKESIGQTFDSPESAAAARDRPFCGWRGNEQVVTRTIVTYTTTWTEVPGHEGSLWLDCWHKDRDEAHAAAPGGYARPHAFRVRDMTAGEDGQRRYTCPVCGIVWRYTGPAPAEPQEALF